MEKGNRIMMEGSRGLIKEPITARVVREMSQRNDIWVEMMKRRQSGIWKTGEKSIKERGNRKALRWEAVWPAQRTVRSERLECGGWEGVGGHAGGELGRDMIM